MEYQREPEPIKLTSSAAGKLVKDYLLEPRGTFEVKGIGKPARGGLLERFLAARSTA